jgi:decaprenylphospho-beta-D-ribofuranose 2-oxidase
MAVLADHDHRYRYTVAWTGSLARGRGLGRSIVTSGDFAEPADLPVAAACIRGWMNSGRCAPS